MNKREVFMNTYIDNITTEETVSLVNDYIIDNKKLHLVGVNADKINQMMDDENLKRIVNECEIINADGASVLLAGKVLGKNIVERVSGIDLMLSLVDLAETNKYPIYLLGAKYEIVNLTAEKLKERNQDLVISGLRDGYFEKSEWESVFQEIKKTNAKMVFIGITSPLKEELIDYFMSKDFNTIYMGVGGSFDVISGKIKRAPKLLQKLHLEWLFRMLNEPRRLFKRYLVGNLKFIGYVIKERLK